MAELDGDNRLQWEVEIHESYIGDKSKTGKQGAAPKKAHRVWHGRA